MKKVIYVVVVLVILLVLSMLLKGNETTSNETTAPAEVTVEATVPAEVAPAEEGTIVVDVEPASKTTAPAVETEETVAEDVVEENPTATADEGETVVE